MFHDRFNYDFYLFTIVRVLRQTICDRILCRIHYIRDGPKDIKLNAGINQRSAGLPAENRMLKHCYHRCATGLEFVFCSASSNFCLQTNRRIYFYRSFGNSKIIYQCSQNIIFCYETSITEILIKFNYFQLSAGSPLNCMANLEN